MDFKNWGKIFVVMYTYGQTINILLAHQLLLQKQSLWSWLHVPVLVDLKLEWWDISWATGDRPPLVPAIRIVTPT